MAPGGPQVLNDALHLLPRVLLASRVLDDEVRQFALLLEGHLGLYACDGLLLRVCVPGHQSLQLEFILATKKRRELLLCSFNPFSVYVVRGAPTLNALSENVYREGSNITSLSQDLCMVVKVLDVHN